MKFHCLTKIPRQIRLHGAPRKTKGSRFEGGHRKLKKYYHYSNKQDPIEHLTSRVSLTGCFFIFFSFSFPPFLYSLAIHVYVFDHNYLRRNLLYKFRKYHTQYTSTTTTSGKTRAAPHLQVIAPVKQAAMVRFFPHISYPVTSSHSLI